MEKLKAKRVNHENRMACLGSLWCLQRWRSLRGKTDGAEMLSQGWSSRTSQYPFQPWNSVIASSSENSLAVFTR